MSNVTISEDRLGDSWNVCHPRTGDGMGVVLMDVMGRRAPRAAEPDLTDWSAVTDVLHWQHWRTNPSWRQSTH